MLMTEVGLENQVVYHKTIRLIRTRSKGARTYAKKLIIGFGQYIFNGKTQGALIKSVQ